MPLLGNCKHTNRGPDAGSRRKAGKKAAGKAKGGGQAAQPAAKPGNRNQGPPDAAHCAALALDALTAKIVEWQPDMDGAGECPAQPLLDANSVCEQTASTQRTDSAKNAGQHGHVLLNIHAVCTILW